MRSGGSAQQRPEQRLHPGQPRRPAAEQQHVAVVEPDDLAQAPGWSCRSPAGLRGRSGAAAADRGSPAPPSDRSRRLPARAWRTPVAKYSQHRRRRRIATLQHLARSSAHCDLRTGDRVVLLVRLQDVQAERIEHLQRQLAGGARCPAPRSAPSRSAATAAAPGRRRRARAAHARWRGRPASAPLPAAGRRRPS